MIIIKNRKEFAKAAEVIQGYMCHLHDCDGCPLFTPERECALTVCLSELRIIQEDII